MDISLLLVIIGVAAYAGYSIYQDFFDRNKPAKGVRLGQPFTQEQAWECAFARNFFDDAQSLQHIQDMRMMEGMGLIRIERPSGDIYPGPNSAFSPDGGVKGFTCPFHGF